MCESLKLLIISFLIFKCVQGRSIALMALVFFSLIIVGRVLLLDSENSHVIWFDQWDIVTKYDASRVLSYLLLYEKSSQNIVIDKKKSLYFSSLGQQFGFGSTGCFPAGLFKGGLCRCIHLMTWFSGWFAKSSQLGWLVSAPCVTLLQDIQRVSSHGKYLPKKMKAEAAKPGLRSWAMLCWYILSVKENHKTTPDSRDE